MNTRALWIVVAASLMFVAIMRHGIEAFRGTTVLSFAVVQIIINIAGVLAIVCAVVILRREAVVSTVRTLALVGGALAIGSGVIDLVMPRLFDAEPGIEIFAISALSHGMFIVGCAVLAIGFMQHTSTVSAKWQIGLPMSLYVLPMVLAYVPITQAWATSPGMFVIVLTTARVLASLSLGALALIAANRVGVLSAPAESAFAAGATSDRETPVAF